MISIISQRLAEKLYDLVENKHEVDYLRYGIEIILSGFIKLIVLLITALVLGLLQPMITVLFTFVLFRTLTGGYHYSTYGRCLVVGLLMMTGISYFSVKLAVFLNFQILLSLLIISFLLGLILTYRFAPSNHFYKQITDRQKQKLRKYAFIAIVIWSFLICYLLTNSYSLELILASILGFLFQMSTIHPYSYSFVNKIENLIERVN
ncbi:hypothetical protein BKP45_08400 [Anaerobacillus alkalidiazotrophicus]|uniref:Accessory regulator AgrB n=1 Tax=Anaerobacillus alkalidiazotrophicus TaxID=472963 RepID=A0A1S2MAT2_9BACI|nr:accessory gene regulator B family protein [Anaerobacillus alkalidiazotrophicus]OIJ20805.1 hypothetical protein BKP45_08400 [Anaerobacillus alkalidiazotrophicus]